MSRKHKKKLIRIIIAAVLLVAVTLLPASNIIKLFLYLIPYLVIGWDVVLSAVRNIIHGQVFDEQFLMALATIGAFGTGEYKEAVAVMLFYQIGELFQGIAVGKSRKSIASLMDIRPDSAVVIRNGEEIKVSPEEVEKGETIIVRPGEKIPLDGVVLSGSTTVNTAALTGESLPRDVETGGKVVSGSVNLTGVITVKTESLYAESTVAKILDLVENSSAKKAKTENFITKFAKYFSVAFGVCSAAYNGRMGQMDTARAYIPRGILPVRACNFGSAFVFRRYRRCLKARRACKGRELYRGAFKIKHRCV